MEINVTGIEALEKIGREFPKATARALNRTMSTVKTQMVKDAGKRYKITAKELKDAAGKVTKADIRRLISSFRVKGKRFPLVKFVTDAMIRRSLEQAGKKIARRPKEIKATITRGTGAKYPGVFAAKMVSGHVGIFKRKGVGGNAIKELSTVSPPQIFSGTWERLLQSLDVRAVLEKNLKHEIEYELNGRSTTPQSEAESE